MEIEAPKVIFQDLTLSWMLNCLGNLMLISGTHNASIGNKPFKHKLSSYKDNPLLNQQAEIKDFAKDECGEPVWKQESIDARHKKIIDFAVQAWSFDKVMPLVHTT